MFNSSIAAFWMLHEAHTTPDLFLLSDVKIVKLAWEPPVMEYVKINFDGSFYSSSSTGGVGVVIRDWRGSFLFPTSDGCSSNSILSVECRTAHLALASALELGYWCVVLEGNSLKVISLLLDPDGETPWHVSSLIHDCFYFSPSFDRFSVSHVK